MKVRLVLAIVILLLLTELHFPASEAHVVRGKVKQVGSYLVGFMTLPGSLVAGDDVELIFSIQDLAGRNVENVTIAAKVLNGGELIQEYLSRTHGSGDFSLKFSAKREGEYIVAMVIGKDVSVPADFLFTVASGEPNFPIVYGALLGSTLAVGMAWIYHADDRRRKAGKGEQAEYPITQVKHAIISRYARSFLCLSSGILLTVLMFSSWAEFYDGRNLSFHMMVEHTGFSLGAALISYGMENFTLGIAASRKGPVTKALASVYTGAILANRRVNARSWLSSSVAGVLLGYWHIPENFNLAVWDDGVHFLMHLSFVATGVMAFLSIKVLSRKGLIIYATLLMFAMLLGGTIMITTPIHLYLPYQLFQQRDAGVLMLVPHPFVVAVLAIYLFSRYVWRE